MTPYGFVKNITIGVYIIIRVPQLGRPTGGGREGRNERRERREERCYCYVEGWLYLNLIIIII